MGRNENIYAQAPKRPTAAILCAFVATCEGEGQETETDLSGSAVMSKPILDLEPIKARAGKATKPWEADWEHINYEPGQTHYDEFQMQSVGPTVRAMDKNDQAACERVIEQVRADTDFMNNARTDIDALVAEVESDREVINALKKAVFSLCDEGERVWLIEQGRGKGVSVHLKHATENGRYLLAALSRAEGEGRDANIR
jgi:hypothetical protein